MHSSRTWARLSLALLALAVLAFVLQATQDFPRGLIGLLLIILSGWLAWRGLLRAGRPRLGYWASAAVLVAAALVVQLSNGIEWAGFLALGLVAAASFGVKRAFAVRGSLDTVAPPQRAVVVWNPKSGGGKALTNHLAAEARKRGIEPIELKPGDDLVVLVRDAVARGADGLMAAGGDGTQALVATIAAEHDLPFACIPSGTRNHFALDLGVDRDDVVGALDAFVNGGEKRVDLGEVAGRTFVNNVSLGLYAQAVQSEGYRDAKIRTILATAPTVLAEGGGGHELRWTGPDGSQQRSAAVILVSNNPYRFGHVLGAGTRPRMDGGTLGIAVMGGAADSAGRRRALAEWEATEFVVESDSDIPLGVDGEALVMPSPVAFRIRPNVLRVRIAAHHPGASPSAGLPSGFREGLAQLAALAGGGPAQQ
jgi:diacylglycerol kinase family enzyme